MYVTIRIKIAKDSSWRSKIETEDKELSIDLPDNLPAIDLSGLMQSVFLATVEEYNAKKVEIEAEGKSNG